MPTSSNAATKFMKPAIFIENLGKCYRLDHENTQSGRYKTLRDTVTGLVTAPLKRWRNGNASARREDFWALKDVSFDVKQGEVLGIIGRNGAGKSTLLKILSRITKPTNGRANLSGRVASLLEVGTGFHPELTGRENIFLNGSILGMSRVDITRRFDEIVAFAGVEQFLDTPIKRYSSGMYVRLAFAVAAHLELEILLVDEVLAVGDQAFQKKCIGRMSDIASSGRTIILVSHDLPMLSKMCTKAVWMEKGSVALHGTPSDAIQAYCQKSSEAEYGHTVSLKNHPGRRGGSQQLMESIALLDARQQPTTSVFLGGAMTIELEIGGDFAGQTDNTIVFNICDMFGTSIAEAHSKVQSALDLTGLSSVTVRCMIDDMRLVPGDYSLTVRIGDSSDVLDRVENAIRFSVLPADIYGTGKIPKRRDGMFALAASWELNPRTASPIDALPLNV